jgi:hypothetical protein
MKVKYLLIIVSKFKRCDDGINENSSEHKISKRKFR